MQFATEVLFKLVTDEGTKLRWGVIQRENMASELRAGKKPEGYRADWLRNTASIIIQVLGAQAQGFNTAYPYDRISINDLMDVLQTSYTRLKNIITKNS